MDKIYYPIFSFYQDYVIYISDRKLKKLMGSNKYELMKS